MNQEDVNGEKLTVKKWWIFGADCSRFTQSFSRFIRDINGENNNLVIDDFFTVSFSRFAPPLKRNLDGHFRATFSRVWVFEGKFHQDFTSKRCEKRKLRANFQR